jgi:hypothetical protein
MCFCDRNLKNLETFSYLIENLGLYAEEGKAGGARFGLDGPGEGGEKVAARLRLPIGVHDAALLAAHHPVVPQPRLGVDGFTHCAQHLAKETSCENLCQLQQL